MHFRAKYMPYHSSNCMTDLAWFQFVWKQLTYISYYHSFAPQENHYSYSRQLYKVATQAGPSNKGALSKKCFKKLTKM